LGWKPFIQLPPGILLVHGGVSPHTILEPLSGKDFNEITRMRFIRKSDLEKVSTVHNNDGTYGPEIPRDECLEWQEVYDGRFGLILHGHDIQSMDYPVFWQDNVKIGKPTGKGNDFRWRFYDTISLDTGCVMGGYLSAIVIDTKSGMIEIKQVKAHKEYCK